MDKDSILTFVKKNAFALACGIVALAAVVAVFYPFNGLVQALTEKAQQEAANYGTLTAFVRGRHLPQVDPAKTTPVDLAGFPTQAQVKVGKDAVVDLTAQSEAALNVVVGLNDTNRAHPLLVPGALPEPVSAAPKFLFVDVYKRALSTDPTMSGEGSPTVAPPIQADPTPTVPMAADEKLAGVHAQNLANDILHAGLPADAKLIDARRIWLRDNVYAPRIVTGPDGVAINQADVDRAFADAAKQVPDDLNRETAAGKQVYLDKDAFSVLPSFISSNNNPQLADIWFAQLSFWMQRDMAVAVAAEINAGSTGVATSPVKRLLKLSLPPVPMYLFPGPSGVAGAAAAVGPSPATETQVLPALYALGPTGRVSNAMYDVVPFRLAIDVEADHVNQVLQELVRNRLIYIGNQDLYTIDPASLAPLGYLYGPRPVVRLVVTGEELFLRKWTVPLMPNRIKELLLLMAPPGGTLTPLGGNPMMPDDNGGMPGMGGH